jgi:hypothetical protein
MLLAGVSISNGKFRTQVITEEHRSVPGAMFGGWGPHLGHMVRVSVPLPPGYSSLYAIYPGRRDGHAGVC